MEWLVLQLADSGFPTGGFAHSAGLEMLVQAGEVAGAGDVRRFVEQLAWQTGFGSMPLAGGAHADPSRLADLDALADAFLTSKVANRASRLQGRAFAATCADAFDRPELVAVRQSIRARRLAGHHAPVFGAVTRALGLELSAAQRLLVHAAARSALAAAVRLGVIGPLDAQRLQFDLAPLFARVQDSCADLGPEALAQTSPVLEAFASHHDGLYSRLFQS